MGRGGGKDGAGKRVFAMVIYGGWRRVRREYCLSRSQLLELGKHSYIP